MKNFILAFVVIGILVIAWVFFSGKAEAPLQENNDGPADVSEETQRYTSPDNSFSLVLPQGDTYQIDENFENQQSPELLIKGVKFTVPSSLSSGTNLSSDTYLSVESLPLETCTADRFFDGIHPTTTFTEEGVAYSMATSSNAGAGNRYDETVYALTNTNPCMAVRYVVHYTALENYEEGTVSRFDEQALFAAFDSIRRSLQVNQ